MGAKTLIFQLPNQVERTMDSMNNHSDDNLGSFNGDRKVSLRLWDMDPSTSTVRWIVRNKIIQLLSERLAFCELEPKQTENIARFMDEILLARAPSQVHYMNLDTLESRLNDLISDQKNVDDSKNLASDVSLSSNGYTTHSCKMPHNMDLSSPVTSYHSASTSSGDCATVSTSASSSLLGDGSTASRRYLPNGHHRVVASESIAADGNAMHCPENILQTLPAVSKNCTANGFSTVIPPNEYIGCWNGHVLHDIGCNSQSSMSQMASSRIPDEFFNGTPSVATNTDQTISGASLSEQCENHFIPGCNFYSSAKLVNPAPSFGSTGNFRNVHQSGIHSHLKMTSVNAPAVCSKKEQFLEFMGQEKLRPSCQRIYIPYNQSHQEYLWDRERISGFEQSQRILNGSSRVKGCVVHNQSSNQSDQLQLPQNEQYFHKLHLSTENRKTKGTPLRRILNGYNLVSGCFTPNQVSVKSQTDSVAHQFHPFIEGCKSTLKFSSEGSVADRFGKPRGEEQYGKYHEFHLLYQHVLCCRGLERKCDDYCCMKLKLLLEHISNCSDSCNQNYCSNYKKLLNHYRECRVRTCDICGPDKTRMKNNLQGTFSSDSTESIAFSSTINTMEHEQLPAKRTRIEDTFLFHKSQNEISKVSISVEDAVHSFPEGKTLECQELSTSLNTTPESMELDTGPPSSSSQESYAECCVVKVGDPVLDIKMKLHLEPSTSLEVPSAQPEKENVQVPVEAYEFKLEDNCMNTTTSDFQVMETKPWKLKKGVSLIESFTPEKISEHVNSLKQSVGQSKTKIEENQGVGEATEMNTCSLCGMKDLRFDPPPRYCAQCSRKINPKGVFYYVKSIANGSDNGSDSEILFCRDCIRISGENVSFGGMSILKANLGRGKNYAETYDLDEWWVRCDKCTAWQHQICTLFNSIRHEAVQADHTCPNCILQEIESGEHKPLLQSTIPGAKDLPTTVLSDHIEKWVFRRLEEERQERANSLGKTYSEVPTAEGLVVRVVSSVVKKLEVKQVFRDIFHEETYPSEFPYKSKAILLFQNIDGADVCLFGMYVQEYGSGCADPNRRRVCISYIDSVKYFRPKVTAVTGEALRTFVYHEILIGYLDYCKKRGFTSCHIWACPPLKQDGDYILYCHPKIQKMPKSDKLREWYRTVMQKAAKENIVVEYTNLYDHFFVNTSECKVKITAARLPYFDCDYWPGAAEVLLQSENGSKPQMEGRKAVTNRVLRAFRRDSLIENPKDILLMYELGNNIRQRKKDLIMVLLRHVCKYCCHPILSRKQWVCNVCKNFQLCEKCFLLEQNLEMKDGHPRGTSEKHSFHEVQMDNIPVDTIDDDEAIRSEIFDTRLMFLSHCQDNNYQFDTLRRAKHSTMMILYNLHNPFSSLVSACIGCHNGINTADGWHCLSCTGYDLCDSCYQNGAFLHEHELVHSATVTDHTSQQNNPSKRVQFLQELSGASLLHASKCGAPRCTYPYCRKLKGLFHHSAKCQTRANGGCEYCRKIWCILRAHAQSCGEPECHVPRCKDLKDHFRKKQSRSRAGAKQRMKERIMKQKNSEALQADD